MRSWPTSYRNTKPQAALQVVHSANAQGFDEAQVYDPQRHLSEDGVATSETDAKRMLDRYIATELTGGPNEGLRRHAKAALSLANDLQHSRTADYRQAALCAEATTSVVNIVAIISGRRDRSDQPSD